MDSKTRRKKMVPGSRLCITELHEHGVKKRTDWLCRWEAWRILCRIVCRKRYDMAV